MFPADLPNHCGEIEGEGNVCFPSPSSLRIVIQIVFSWLLESEDPASA